MEDTVKSSGYFTYVLTGPDGEVKDKWEGHNLVTTAGKNALAAWLAAATQATTFMPYVALGSGAVAPAIGNTALGSELGRAAGAVTSASAVFQNIAVFGPGVATGALTESGLFSASSSGTMFCRQTFSVRNKDAGDTLSVTWQVTFS